jgi:predicted Zn-dependent protease
LHSPVSRSDSLGQIMGQSAANKIKTRAAPAATPGGSRPRLRLLGGVVAVVVLGALVLGFVAWRRHLSFDRRQGLELAAQGRFSEAEPYLRRALERRPEDVEVIKTLTLGQLASERWEDAEASLGRWCELRPGDPEPFKRRMELRISRRQFPQALEDGRHVLELEPENFQVGRQVAPMILIVGRLEEAEREGRRWLRKDPENPDLLYLVADACHQQGKNAEAEAVLDPLLRRQPDAPAPLFLRAMLYDEADQPDKAIPLLRRVVELDQRPAQQLAARYHLSLALARTGKPEEARRVMAEVQWHQAMDLWYRRDHPKIAGLLLRVAEAMLGVGKTEEAVPLLDKILQEDPNCGPEAVRLLEKAAGQQSAAAHRLLAAYYEKQGQNDKAATHRRQAGP